MKKSSILSLTLSLALCAAASSSAVATRASLSSAMASAVRITPTVLPVGSTSIDIGPTLWHVQGFDLRGLLSEVYGIERSRIDLSRVAATVEPPRFDVSLSLMGDESEESVRTVLAAAIARRFHLAAALETRSVEVYLLTAPNGPGPDLHVVRASSAHPAAALASMKFGADDLVQSNDAPAPESITLAGRTCPGVSSAGISAHPATLASVARSLEQELDRPILDETHLAGLYNFDIPEYRTREQLVSLLHNRLGVNLQPAHRDIAMLAIRPVTADGGVTQTASLTE